MSSTPTTALGTSDQLGRLLYQGSLRGQWTIEDLDHWPQGSAWLQPALQRQAVQRGDGHGQHRNLARDWIRTHPREADLLLRESLDQEQLDLGPSNPGPIADALGHCFGTN